MSDDQRHQARFPVANTVFIEVASAEFGSYEAGSIARCKTLEISRGGLRIRLDCELPIGATLQIGLELPAAAGTLYLVGEVKWSRPTPGTDAEPGWEAGLTLLDAEDSDFDEWQKLVTMMEN